jgi:hypothetical protein
MLPDFSAIVILIYLLFYKIKMSVAIRKVRRLSGLNHLKGVAFPWGSTALSDFHRLKVLLSYGKYGFDWHEPSQKCCLAAAYTR